MTEVGIIIQNRLDELGMSKTKLAELIGVSEGAVRKWQNQGLENTKIDRIKKLSSILGISIPVLLGIASQEFSTRTTAIARKFDVLSDKDKEVIESIVDKYEK